MRAYDSAEEIVATALKLIDSDIHRQKYLQSFMLDIIKRKGHDLLALQAVVEWFKEAELFEELSESEGESEEFDPRVN
jgi:hypothetical protein